jgi:hypothetical protein
MGAGHELSLILMFLLYGIVRRSELPWPPRIQNARKPALLKETGKSPRSWEIPDIFGANLD